MTVIYVQNLIPTISTSKVFNANLVKKLNAKVFAWDWNAHHTGGNTLSDFQNQLALYLDHYQKQDVCLILDSFASFIFKPLQTRYPNIKRLIIINPVLKNIIWKTSNLKNMMLPTSITSTIYKYMYLFKSLAGVRSDPLWLSSIQTELALIGDKDLLFHKLFDQLLKRKLINCHHEWLRQLTNAHFICGSHNPLTPSQFLTKVLTSERVMIIANSGFCLIWEQPELFLDALKSKAK